MESNTHMTIGDLVDEAFDEAAHYSADPRSVSHLATQAAARLLRRARSRLPVTDATQGEVADGYRVPAYGTSVPVRAQIRVAVYAASLGAKPDQDRDHHQG